MARFERWLEVKRIFEEALECLPEERAAFLDRSCSGDDALRHEVEALLDAPPVPTSSLANLLGLPDRREDSGYAEGDTIDRFVVVRCIGRGGMGTVYEVRDTRNDNRPVALKVLSSRSARLSQDKRLARFSEASIVTLHDSGQTPEGLPYFVFEYVDGEPITAFCERRSLRLEERLRLFLQVCAAVQYAHQRGVIHCDLKPENILITPTGNLKLLDFGIARSIDSQDLAASLYPSPITLPFASPEQVSNEVTTPLSDVYALGVLLCVLLTGRLPYRDARTLSELRDAVRHLAPAPPSELVLHSEEASRSPKAPSVSSPPAGITPAKLARRLRGDLDAAVLTALRKDPEERYQSVEAFADDIRRHLAHEPLRARRGSRRYRVAKFLRRNRARVAAAAVALAVLSILFGALVLKQRQAMRERDLARQEATRARELSTLLEDIFLFYDPETKPGDAVTVRALLDQAMAQLPATLASQPVTRTRLLLTIGRVYQNLTLYEDAERCFQRALDLARSGPAPNQILEADALLWLGILRRDQGQYDTALDLLTDSLTLRDTRVPEVHPDRAFTIAQIGSTLLYQGAHEEAEARLREAIHIHETVPEPNEKDLVQAKSFLLSLLIEAHRIQEAEPLVEEILAARRRLYGPKHPLVATTLQDLAVVLQSMNKAEEAERVQRELVNMFEELYGPRNQRTIVATLNLGAFLMVEGRGTESVSILRDAIELAVSIFGPDHPNTLLAKVQLARALIQVPDLVEAEEVLKETYEEALAALGPDDRVVGGIRRIQGQCAFAQGDYEAAEAHFRQAIEIVGALQGDESYGVAIYRAEWASTLAALERFEEAEPHLLEYHRRAEGADAENALVRLVDFYEGWGKVEEAAEYRMLLADAGATTHTRPE